MSHRAPEKIAKNSPPNKMTDIHRHLRGGLMRHESFVVYVMLVAVCLAANSINSALAIGQDFEDLSKETFGNVGRPMLAATNQQNVFQNRQSQAQQMSQSSGASRQFRPNRFMQNSNNQQVQQYQQASAQESSPPAFLASTGSQGNQQLQQQTAQAPANIEQMMKNALPRTAQLSVAPEPRLDMAPKADEPQLPASSLSSQQTSARSTSSQPASFTPVPSSPSFAPTSSDKIAEPSEPSTAEMEPSEEDKQTTASQTSTGNGHETVYSDQRFANLFARRGANKKQRIQPQEQVKAKPTLPSFIKSPPDPKQFAAPPQVSGLERNPNQQGGNSFASQRIQQQQQNQARINALNQQKKPVITSTSAANATNKRNSSLNNKQSPPSLTPSSAKSTTPSPKAASSTIKPIIQPFNRVNNDPASVIAMARKRLLANNALESGKLKQQQQNKPAN